MRGQTLIVLLLVASALVPIGAWLLMYANLEPSGLGRSIGKAILVVMAAPAFGGLLMIAGAVMFHHAPRAARIVATVGAVVVLASGLVAAAVLAYGYANCGGAGCSEEFVAAAVGFVYAIAQIGLIALIWRARTTPSQLRG